MTDHQQQLEQLKQQLYAKINAEAAQISAFVKGENGFKRV